MSNSPLSIDKLVQDLSSKLGVEKPQLDSELLTFLAEIRSSNLSLTEDQLHERAYKKLLGSYRRKGGFSTKAVVFKGAFLASTDLIDFNEIARIKALKVWKEDQEMGTTRAVDARLTDEKGIPLDTRTEIFGRPNKKFGSPLEGSSYQRTWYGVGTDLESDSWKWFDLKFYEVAVPPPPKFSVPVKFFAIKKKEGETYLSLNASKVATKVFEELSLPDFNLEEAIRTTAPIVPFHSLESFYEEHKKNKKLIVVVEGDVDNLWLEPNPDTGSRKIIIRSPLLEADMSEGIQVYIPDWVTMDFGEDSRVFVIGRPNRSKKSENYPEGRFQINAYGIVPLERTTPDTRTPTQQTTIDFEWKEIAKP